MTPSRTWSAVVATAAALIGVVATASAQSETAEDPMTRVQSIVEKLSKLKISGYIQARWETGEAQTDTASVSGSSIRSANLDRFYIRRARFKVVYDASPTSQAVVYLDGGDDRDAKLLEAYVTLIEPWTGERRHRLAFGQMNVPFGFENEFSSSRRELPERSRAQNVLFPGERDRGVSVTSQWLPQIETTIGLFNGGGVKDRNFPTEDPTRAKDWVVRGRFTQGDDRLGVSWYQGKALIPLTGPDIQVDRTRLGLEGELGWKVTKQSGLVRGELYAGRNANADSLKTLITSVGGGRLLAPGADRSHLDTDFLGGYVMLVQDVGDRFQLVGRYESFDPNQDLDHDQFERWGFGFSWFWDQHTRVTLAYDVPQTDAPAAGGRFEDPVDNLWTLQFQHKF